MINYAQSVCLYFGIGAVRLFELHVSNLCIFWICSIIRKVKIIDLTRELRCQVLNAYSPPPPPPPHTHTHTQYCNSGEQTCLYKHKCDTQTCTHAHLWWDSSITRDTNRFSDMFDFDRWLCIIKPSFRQVFTPPALHLQFVPVCSSSHFNKLSIKRFGW